MPELAPTGVRQKLLPAGVPSFTLTGGPYTDGRGTPIYVGMNGTIVQIDPVTRKPVQLLHSSGAVIGPTPIPITIDSSGSWAVSGLAACDEPTLAPQPFFWQIHWSVPPWAPSPKYKDIYVTRAMITDQSGVCDFDAFGPVDAGGFVVNQAGVQSVAGHSGVVTAQQITDQMDVDGTRLSTASLAALVASMLQDDNGLPAFAPISGGGLRIFAYTFPTAGYGGTANDMNDPTRPTLLDLTALGVSKMLWLTGDTGNVVYTPDGSRFSALDGSNNPLPVIMQADIVTNEWDPVAGQSTYYLVAKPGCWAMRLTEGGFPEARAFDTTGNLTFTATDQLPIKTHVYLQSAITPSDAGVARCDFSTSDDQGATWQPFGDPVFAGRPLGQWINTSGSSLGILVGGNTSASYFRGGVVSAQIIIGGTLAADLRPQNWAPGQTHGTDAQGNLWTVQNPEASNLVTTSCLAVGGGEKITLTNPALGAQLTTPGLYSTLVLPGFSWRLSSLAALDAYRDGNVILNLAGSPTVQTVDIRIDTLVDKLVAEMNNVTTEIAP